MFRKVKGTIAAGLLGGALVCTIAWAASAGSDAKPKELEIGDFAPLFDLPGTDGKSHALLDCVRQNKKAVAVVFFCNHCPVAQAYQDRLIKLQNEYKDVQLILISSNDPNDPMTKGQDTFDKMKELAKEKSFPCPYLADETQIVGMRFFAKVTPHVFLFDKDLKLQYRGAVDDDMDSSKASKHYLKDAIDALLAGKKVDMPVTQQFGCGIKWKQAAAK